MLTLSDVKINNDYTYIEQNAPTPAEKEPDYSVGQTWLDLSTGFSYMLVDASAGTWQRIEQAIDTKISRKLYPTFTKYALRAYRLIMADRVQIPTDVPQGAKTNDLYTYAKKVGVFGAGSVSAKTLTFDSFAGDLTEITSGDEVYVNGGYYTVDSVGSDYITVVEDIRNNSGNYIVTLLSYTEDFTDAIGRLVHYDIYNRGQMAGKKSERIGTYSYTMGDLGEDGYPSDLIGSLDQWTDYNVGEPENYEY